MCCPGLASLGGWDESDIGAFLLTSVCSGLDTTATELSVVESVFRLGEGNGPNAINTTHKDTMAWPLLLHLTICY